MSACRRIQFALIFCRYCGILETQLLLNCYKLPDWRKQFIIAELWVVYGLYFFNQPIQYPYFLLIVYAGHVHCTAHIMATHTLIHTAR